MKRTLIFSGMVLLAATLSGCVTAEQRMAQQRQMDAYDDAQCQQLGFRPGSDQYGNCRLKMREIRATEGSYNNGKPNISLGLGVVGGF